MSEKSRNFRSSYYDKVGFRGVDEKKALEVLINEKPVDKEKLSKFCLRFTLPSMYRENVWKILLGVLPSNAECHESIMKQRSLHYEDLKNSLEIMRKVNKETPKPIVHTLMYLMTKDILEFNYEAQISCCSTQYLISLASVFLKLSSSEVISFWLFRNFCLHREKRICKIKTMVDHLENILKKEDEVLHEHLKNKKVFEILPLKVWFAKCFAEILHQSAWARICDKIIGGSCKILPFVGAAMLLVRRNSLLSINDLDEVNDLLEKNSEDTSDVIVNKALDMYSS